MTDKRQLDGSLGWNEDFRPNQPSWLRDTIFFFFFRVQVTLQLLKVEL